MPELPETDEVTIFTKNEDFRASDWLILERKKVVGLHTESEFVANSVLQAVAPPPIEGNFTLDALLSSAIGAEFVADSVLLAEAVAQFSADSTLAHVLGGSYTTDAILRRAVSSSITGDGVLSKGVSATVTADSVIAPLSSPTSWREIAISLGATVLWADFPSAGPWTDEIAGLVMTKTGTPTYETGPFGTGASAMKFPDETAYATVPDNSLLDWTTGTVVVVARRDADIAAWQMMVQKGSGGHGLGWSATDKWELAKAGQVSLVTESGTTANGASWITYGASHSGANTGKVHKNGVDVSSSVEASSTLVATSAVLTVGKDALGAGHLSAGTIAGLAYFPTVLTTAQHLALHNAVGAANGGSSVGGAFTANAVLKSGTAFLADSIIKAEGTAQYTASAITRRIESVTLTADASLAVFTGGSFAADSVISSTAQSWRQIAQDKGAMVVWADFTGAGPWTDEVSGLVMTKSGSPVSEAGPFGTGANCLRFPTVNDYATVPDHPSLDMTNGTVVVVLRRDGGAGAFRAFVTKGNTGHYVGFWDGSSDKLVLSKDGITILAKETGTTAVGASWISAGVSHTGVAGSGKIFKNGSDVTSGVDSSTTLSATSLPLTVGRRNEGDQASLGSIAGIAYFPFILTATDHADLHAAIANPNGGGGGGSVSGGSFVANAVLDSGQGALPTGGTESLRGVKPYAQLSAPFTTVLTPYGATQIHAARDAAGVNGRVLIPAAASGVTVNVTMSVAGQKWQVEGANTVINGSLTITATGCEYEGGKRTNGFSCPSSGSGHNFVLRNVRQDGGSDFSITGRSGVRVLNCEFYNVSGNTVGHLSYSNSVGHIDGFLIENCIGLKGSVGFGSILSGNDHDTGAIENGTIKNFVARNNRFDGGVYTADPDNPPAGGGWFGIEVWHNIPNAEGRGGIVEYNDIRGGDVLLSMVRSKNNWVHHNNFTLATAFAVYEAGGSGGNPARGDHSGGVFENNFVQGRGTFCCEVVTTNNLPTGFIIRQNEVHDFMWLTDGPGVNAGFTIIDNALVNVTNVYDGSAGNSVWRNGPTEGPLGVGATHWAPAFMARPVSGPLNLNGNAAVAAVAASGNGTSGSPYLITNKSFNSLGANVIAITIQNVTAYTTVLACDFRDVAEGVYAVNSSNISVGWCRYKNITGPHARAGFNRANFVQYNNVSGGSIYRNKGREGDTEDIVSIFASDNIIVEDNHFEGTNWTSQAGSGIALGDIGGSACIARRNILVNPGQVGIFIAGGTNSTITDNIIFKNQVKSGSGDVGIYVWKQPFNDPSVCSGHTVSYNRIFWLHFNGSQNNFWNGNNCGTILGLSPQTNVYVSTSINPVELTVVL